MRRHGGGAAESWRAPFHRPPRRAGNKVLQTKGRTDPPAQRTNRRTSTSIRSSEAWPPEPTRAVCFLIWGSDAIGSFSTAGVISFRALMSVQSGRIRASTFGGSTENSKAGLTFAEPGLKAGQKKKWCGCRLTWDSGFSPGGKSDAGRFRIYPGKGIFRKRAISQKTFSPRPSLSFYEFMPTIKTAQLRPTSFGSGSDPPEIERPRRQRSAMELKNKKVLVFCSSSSRAADAFVLEAGKLGQKIAHEGAELVFGGTDSGLMGVLARAAVRGGARVTGIIPEKMMSQGLLFRDCSEVIISADLRERKARMLEIADAVVCLPGGVGTLDELAECLALKHLRAHLKPMVLINVLGYFDGLWSFFERMTAEGFASGDALKSILSARSAGQAIEALKAV
ncbi:MAG: TIGR00730 family Rossman fold protein [Candidatus Omnitrophica bacterium]|nr:TIGR00730 family Rossman fold protein [Candidatus Omnitrophota bacterium]